MEKTERFFEGIGTVLCEERPTSEQGDYEIHVYAGCGMQEYNTVLAGFDKFYIISERVNDIENHYYEVGPIENFKFDLITEISEHPCEEGRGDLRYWLEFMNPGESGAITH